MLSLLAYSSRASDQWTFTWPSVLLDNSNSNLDVDSRLLIIDHVVLQCGLGCQRVLAYDLVDHSVLPTLTRLSVGVAGGSSSE